MSAWGGFFFFALLCVAFYHVTRLSRSHDPVFVCCISDPRKHCLYFPVGKKLQFRSAVQ